MKKTLFIIAATLCSCLNVFSQVTSLTVDCQSPGWLSSKIGYGDQLTLESLTVTGFLNSADLSFIGGLIEKSLKSIDLTNVVYTSSNNLPMNMFGSGDFELTKLSLPLSIEGGDDCLNNVFCDTLIIGSESCHRITERFPSIGSNSAKHWILREGVDSIMDKGLRMSEHYQDAVYKEDLIAHSISFPSTLKYIGSFALERCKNIANVELPESVEEIGEGAFQGTTWNPDTLRLPNSLKKYSMYATNYAAYSDHSEPVVFYFPESIEYIDNTYKVWYGNSGGFGRKDCTPPSEIHVKASVPPTFNYSNYNVLLETKVYIPKGSYNSYKNKVPWDVSILIEEVYVEGVSLEEEKGLHVGDEIKLSAQIIPEDATDQTVRWESSNLEVATISDNGFLRALSFGTTLITATTRDGGYMTTCAVNVYEHTTGVEMIDKISLPIDKTYSLSANTLPLETSDGKVTYASDNSAIASVNEEGVVVAHKKGSCTITATSVDGGYTATCEVTVTQPVEALTMEKHSVSLKVGETEKLFAQISPATADDKTVSWYSLNEQVASVDANGNVTALKAGEAWIKAVSNNNTEAKDSCKVMVIQPVTGITLSQESYRLTNIGETIQLEATVIPNDASNKEVTWKSTNDAVCMVANGKVVATGFGTAVVIATTVDGGFIATCAIIVEKDAVPVTEIILSQTSATLVKGGTLQLTATALPTDATNKNLIWKSSSENVCVTTQTGLLIAMNEGTAMITVVPEYGVGQAQCYVSVQSEADAIYEVTIDDKHDSPIYDLMGCKVTHVVKGRLYIRNGKKFIAK